MMKLNVKNNHPWQIITSQSVLAPSAWPLGSTSKHTSSWPVCRQWRSQLGSDLRPWQQEYQKP